MSDRMRTIMYVTVLVATACAAITVTMLFTFADDYKEETALEWKDPGTGTLFRLTLKGSFIGRTKSRLYVTKDGTQQSRTLDDDARFGTARFVRYKNWLLVLNDDLAFGGYDLDAGKIYGEYQWDKLPFTHWGGSGKPVAQAVISDEGGGVPVNYSPCVRDPALDR